MNEGARKLVIELKPREKNVELVALEGVLVLDDVVVAKEKLALGVVVASADGTSFE